jgi:DNA-binding transcriptional ArsR family regulator
MVRPQFTRFAGGGPHNGVPMANTYAPQAHDLASDPTEELRGRAEHEASFFRALGNPLRVLLVWLLSERSRTLQEITLLMGASTGRAMRHLRILQYSGLVEVQQHEGATYYRIVDDQELRHCLVFRKRPRELLQHLAAY